MDLAVINLLENKTLENKDFVRTVNSNLRLKPTGTRKVVNVFSNKEYLDFVRLDSYSNRCYRFHYEQSIWYMRFNDGVSPCNVT